MRITNKVSIILIFFAMHATSVSAANQQQTRFMDKKPGAVVQQSNPSVIYVNQKSTSETQDGQSWATAFSSLAEALTSDLADKQEIWVAKGTYYPTVATDRNTSFMLQSGRGLYGGFQGNKFQREQRNWIRNKTILSGEIGDQTVLADNVYHVVTGADDAILDGFTISEGYAMLADGEVDNTGVMVEVPD